MEQNCSYTVRLINIVSTEEFYGFKLDDIDRLKDLNTILSNVYGKLNDNPVNRYYWPAQRGCQRVYRTSHGHWRRVVIEKCVTPSSAIVRQLDYGISEEVNLNNLIPYLNIQCNKYPALAYRFTGCPQLIKTVSNDSFKKLYSQDPCTLEYKDAILFVNNIKLTSEDDADDNDGPFNRTYEVFIMGFLETHKNSQKKAGVKQQKKLQTQCRPNSLDCSRSRTVTVRLSTTTTTTTATFCKSPRRSRSSSSSTGRQPVEYKISKQLPAAILARQRSTDNMTADMFEIVSSNDDKLLPRRPILKKRHDHVLEKVAENKNPSI